MISHRKTLLTGGVALMLLASIFASLNPVLIQIAFNLGVSPTELMVLRLLIAFPCFFLTGMFFSPIKKMEVTKRETVLLAVVGILGMGGSTLCMLYAVLHLGASMARLVYSVFPIFTTLLAFFIMHQPITIFKKISIVISILGVILVISPISIFQTHQIITVIPFIGIVLGLTAAFCWSFSSIAIEMLLKNNSPLVTSAYSIGFMLLFFSIIFGVPSFHLNLRTWTVIILFAVVTYYIPFLLINYAIKDIGASYTTIMQSIGPAFTVISAWILLNEKLTLIQIAGMALLIISVYLINRETKMKHN